MQIEEPKGWVLEERKNSVQQFYEDIKLGKARVKKENEPWGVEPFDDSQEELCKLTIEYNIGA